MGNIKKIRRNSQMSLHGEKHLSNINTPLTTANIFHDRFI